MVDQSKKYENVSGTKSCEEVADLVYNTIYNYLTDCQEKYAYPEFLNFFNKAKKYNKIVIPYFCSEAYESTIRPPIAIDNINKFKMLQLAYAAKTNCNLKIKEGVIQHIEVNSKGHPSYVMYEPLKSFNAFEGSVKNFCRLNPNSSGTYITPIFQNNKFYLGLVDIENGQFNKEDMKIYVPKDQESTAETAKSCIGAMEDIFKHIDVSQSSFYKNNFRKFSDFQKENTQRDSSDDDGPIVELVTNSSDESQDMPHTQHDVPNHDNTQHNEFKFDEGNHFFWNIPNSYFLIDSDIDHSNQRALTEHDIDALSSRIDSDITVLSHKESLLYTGIKPIKEKLQKGENITFEQACHGYCGISGERLIIGDVEFLQLLCGIEKGADFDWLDEISAEMHKQNQQGELIHFYTLPKVYHYNAFGQTMRDFLDKNQNFSGIFAITCSTRDEDYEIENTELCYFLTTVEIKNGKITQINTSGGSWNGADSDSGVLAAERLDALLSSVSYEAYRCQYCDDKYLSWVESSIGEKYKSNSYKQREQHQMEFNQPQFNMPTSPLPQFDNMPLRPNTPLYNPDPQDMPLYNGDQRNTSRYVYGTNHTKRDPSNYLPPLYVCDGFDLDFLSNGDRKYLSSCYRNHTTEAGIDALSREVGCDILNSLLQESSQYHSRQRRKREQETCDLSWKVFKEKLKKQTTDYFDVSYFQHGYWLNSEDLKLLQLYYAERCRKIEKYQVKYHYDKPQNSLTKDNDIEAFCQSIVTEIHKDDEDLSYFMMPSMRIDSFKDEDIIKEKKFQNIEYMAQYLSSNQVQDGIYLIPTCDNQHWELTCVKKQGDVLEYFVTSIPSDGSNCGLNTVKAMMKIIEEGYENTKKTYKHRLDKQQPFINKEIVVENEYYDSFTEQPPRSDEFYGLDSDDERTNFANNGHRTNFSSAQTINNGKSSLNEYDPFAHLRIQWDPQNNWKPLPINDEEFETERDCPFPFEWDDPDPLTLDDRINRMLDVLNDKDIGEPNNTPSYTPERRIIDNDKPIIHIEEPSKPRYILYSDDNYKNTRSSGTYVPQRPGPGRKIEPPYFNIFTKFIESGTSWTNYYFSFEDAQLNDIFQNIKDNEAWNNDIMRRNLRERFDQVSSSNGGKIALQYNDDQGRQIKETIDLNHIGTYVESHNYEELKEEEEKKLTQFLFHCEVAEMMKKARDRYGHERIPDIKLDDIFNSGEACNVQIGQKQIGFDIREPKEDFLATAADILCTDVRKIQETLSHNYFQDKDNLTISVDRSQGITSASEEKDIRKMYFDIAFNKKSFTCTVLGKQRKFDHLLPCETFVDRVAKSFESAHLVTGFDALSTDIEKKHGKITYKVKDRESDKENFLLALYEQEPCTMSYYVNGQERRIQYDTKTRWQKAIETMQEDAKADGLEAYKQQIRSSTILQQIKTDNGRKFGGDGAFSCEIVLANDDCTNKNLSTILPNCLKEDGSVNFAFEVNGKRYELEPKTWLHGQGAKELSKIYEQQIASCYIASSIFNSDVDKIKIGEEEIGIDKTNGSNSYQIVQQILHTALQNKQDIELFIGEKQSTISTKSNVIRHTDNALTEVRLGAKEVQRRVDAFKNALLTTYDDDSQCFIEESGNKFYFIDENGVNCTKDIHDKGRNLKAQDLRNCKIREQQFDEDASYDIDFYDNVLSGRIGIIKKDIEYAYKRFFLLHDLDDYRSKGQEDNTGSEYTYKFLKDGIEQTKHDDDTKTQLIYKHKSGEEITYTLPSFNDDGYDDMYDNDRYAGIIVDFKLAIQDVQVFNDMDIDQMDGNGKVYIKVNGEQKDDCYIEGLWTNNKLNTLQEKFNFLTTGNPLSNYQPIKLRYKNADYICSHEFQDNGNQYITRDNFQKNFDNFATILDMQEQGFIQVQYSDGSPCNNNQDLYKAICYKKNVGREENKTVQIVYGGKPTVLEPDKGYDIISAKLTDIKEQQKQDVEELQKALKEAGLELNTTEDSHQLYIEDKTSGQTYFFGIEGVGRLAINEKENLYTKLLNTRENVYIVKEDTRRSIVEERVAINSLVAFKECLNHIVQNELNDTLNKYVDNVQNVDDTFRREDVPDAIDPREHTIKLCGNQTIKYDTANVKSMRDAQKKVECAPHPLLAQGISGGFLENSLIVDDTGCVKIKPKHCNEEYQLFTRQGGRDQPVQDVAFKGKNTKEILDVICQKYSDKPNMQIYAINGDGITTSAIPLYASAARAGDKDRFFDSFYQSFEKLKLYNRLKKIRADGDESKIRITRADNSSFLVAGDKDLERYFKAVNAPVLATCRYGESNEHFEHWLNTNYDNPLNDHTFDNVDQYIRNTIDSKPSKEAEEVLSRIKYNTASRKTTINGREITFYKTPDGVHFNPIGLVEDDKKPGFIDYKKLHKKVKCFKDTDKLIAVYIASDGAEIISNDIGFEDSSLKNFVDRVELADQIYQMQNSRKIKNLEIFDASTKNNIDITGKDAAQIYNLIKNKDNLSIKFKTRGQSIRTKIKCNAGGLRKLKRIQKVTTKTITDNKDLVDVKDFDMPVEVDTDVDNEIIQESESQLINKNYDPFEDIENNPELRKLVELFIEQSDPDMLATIKNNELITCLNSGTIIRNFRNSAKYEKDYLANSPDATNTMEYIKELDEILKKDGDFYDKCNCYDDTGIKLSKTNLHELQLLAIQEYLQSHDTQKAKYFTSDKANGPSYIYLEDKKMLISLSPEKYDDSKCDNKELEELLKNTSITKVTTKKEGDDWVLDCYLDKDKEHLIVDSRNDGRQYDNVSGGIWAARATNEIIELGVENFQILNTYRQTVQDYPEFLKGETGEDLNRIKLSMREFKRCKEEEQTIEKLKDIIKDVANKTIKEVNYELKYVAENKDAEKRKKDKEKKEKEEIETQEKKEKLKIEMEEEMQKIHRDQKDKKFITTTASCSAALGFIVGGPIGIVVAIGVGLISLLSKKVIERNKQKHKEKDENIMDKNKNFVENKPLLEAQPSLGNEVYNDSEKSKKDTTKLLAEDLSKVFTKDLDLKANNILVDNVKVKKTEQVRESS